MPKLSDGETRERRVAAISSKSNITMIVPQLHLIPVSAATLLAMPERQRDVVLMLDPSSSLWVRLLVLLRNNDHPSQMEDAGWLALAAS